MLPGPEASGFWAAKFVAGTLGGYIFYYGGIAVISRATLRLLDRMGRNLMRRCGGLRPEHPSHMLIRPRCADGLHPASVLYAAAIVHLNLRTIATEWLWDSVDRLELLQSTPHWPSSKYACGSLAPVLQQASCGELFIWAVKELGLAIVQPNQPCPTSIPAAFWGEASLDHLPGSKAAVMALNPMIRQNAGSGPERQTALALDLRKPPTTIDALALSRAVNGGHQRGRILVLALSIQSHSSRLAWISEI
jgi:hypothetical protein